MPDSLSMMAYIQWMITNVFLLVITLIAFVGNGAIAGVIIFFPSLRKKTSNYLIGTLTASTSLISLICIPYEAILIAGLAPNQSTNYSSAAINYSSAPFVGGTMIICVLTLGIGWDRMYALLHPIQYRSVNHARQTQAFFSSGVLLAILITAFHLYDADMEIVKPDCSAGGCFWGNQLRIVWAICTVIISGLTTVFCIILMVKLRRHRIEVASQSRLPQNMHEEHAFMRVNKIALYVVLGSTVFVTVPMTVNGYSVVWQSVVFQVLGPFVAIGVFCSAAFNVVIYGFKQRDIRTALASILRGKLTKTSSIFLGPSGGSVRVISER